MGVAGEGLAVEGVVGAGLVVEVPAPPGDGEVVSPPVPPLSPQAANVKAKPSPKAKVTIFLFIHSSFTDCSSYILQDDDNNTSFARLAGK